MYARGHRDSKKKHEIDFGSRLAWEIISRIKINDSEICRVFYFRHKLNLYKAISGDSPYVTIKDAHCG